MTSFTFCKSSGRSVRSLVAYKPSIDRLLMDKQKSNCCSRATTVWSDGMLWLSTAVSHVSLVGCATLQIFRNEEAAAN